MAGYPFLRLRIMLSTAAMIGPGKADLLQAIHETGSIAAAGRRMGMSYKRAWHLIDTLNAYFRESLVTTTKGGKAGGGARLTATGKTVLECYQRIEAKAALLTADDLQVLAGLAVSPSADAA